MFGIHSTHFGVLDFCEKVIIFRGCGFPPLLTLLGLWGFGNQSLLSGFGLAQPVTPFEVWVLRTSHSFEGCRV